MLTKQFGSPGRRREVFRLLLEAAILIAAYLAYELVRRLVAPTSHEAFGHAINIIRFEQQLGIFFEPDLQSLIVDHHWLVTIFNWIYVWGYLPVIGAAGLYLYLFRRPWYARYRNAFLLSGAAGLVVFAMHPVAPPRMFPELGFIDTVHINSGFYSTIQDSEFVNEFAAVPSFHFGWILLVGMAVIQTTRHLAFKVVGVALPLLMLLAIIFTANHYVIDAVIGGALVLLAFAAVTLVERPPWRRRPALLRRSSRPLC